MTSLPRPSLLRRLPPAAVVFGLAFLARLLVLWSFAGSPHFGVQGGDSRFYHLWALRILDGQWTDHHAFYGLPGYAWVLAGFYRLFGVRVFPVALAQITLEAGTATLVFALARRAVSESRLRLALPAAAALAWVLYTPAQVFAVILMPTMWLVFAYWLCVWWAERQAGAARPGAALGMGLLTGATATLVATILFALPLLGAGGAALLAQSPGAGGGSHPRHLAGLAAQSLRGT